MKSFGRVRLPIWLLLAAVAAWGAVSTYRRMTRATEVLATTVCPFRGPPRMVISPSVAAEDTQPVRIHEEIHAAQCRELGPVRYRWRNVFPSGKLALEAPAYCAAASARIRAGQDSARVGSRLRDDVTEALADIANATTVLAALNAHCPAIASVRPALRR